MSLTVPKPAPEAASQEPTSPDFPAASQGIGIRNEPVVEETAKQKEESRDMGLGSKWASTSTTRFLNRDGTFNARHVGVPFYRSMSSYHFLLSLSWAQFLLVMIAAYFLINLFFGFCYYLCGIEQFDGVMRGETADEFLQMFFFSVQTFGTIGYGHISPMGFTANVLVTIEAFVGLICVALVTGVVFARFSRPQARIIFSNHALIAPYRNLTAFMFRIANERNSQLIDVTATVTLSKWEEPKEQGGQRLRKFYSLELERARVIFFPLHWIVVHAINEKSPLYGETPESLAAKDAEFFVLLAGMDETFSQTVHSRSSYKHDELRWNRKFTNIFVDHPENPDGPATVDLSRIHDTEPA